MKDLILKNEIVKKIYMIRNKKVMLDRDLAALYGVENSNLRRQIKRNIKRFPKDFAFEMTSEELEIWISQFGRSNYSITKGIRYLPYAFTQEGVAMLSSVLRSDQAIEVNIEIMRAFVRLREIAINHKELWRKIMDMESRYNRKFRKVFEAIKKLMEPEIKPKRVIGFKDPNKDE